MKGNLWKLFVAEFTQRRYFFPILSIYFLTLPDTNAQQIGLWTGIGYLGEFIFEIPSGYLSDRIGHKKMLVLSKLFLMFAVVSLIFANSIVLFIIGAVLISMSFAAQTGTQTAFLHETLLSLKKEKTLVTTASKIFANARLVSAFLIIIVPLGAQVSIRTPLYFSLGIDLIGLLVVLMLVNPSITEKLTQKKSILKILGELRGGGFYPVVIFTSAITGFMIASGSYVFPYLASLGFPIAFLGVIPGMRAVGTFFFGHSIVRFETKLNIKRIFIFDLILFPSVFILIGFLNNLVLISILLIIIGMYGLGRVAFVDGYLGKYYIQDKNYMATALSIKGQTSMLFNFVTVFGIGFIMRYSYEIGYYVMGGFLFIILFTTFFFVENLNTK